jgi:hypothetical protein
MILPGFEGGSHSTYIRRFASECTKNGIRTVTLNFRGYAGQNITVRYSYYWRLYWRSMSSWSAATVLTLISNIISVILMMFWFSRVLDTITLQVRFWLAMFDIHIDLSDLKFAIEKLKCSLPKAPLICAGNTVTSSRLYEIIWKILSQLLKEPTTELR